MDAILHCLHFRDNTKIDKDGYFKVQQRTKHFPFTNVGSLCFIIYFYQYRYLPMCLVLL
jgi:hypothetical protein